MPMYDVCVWGYVYPKIEADNRNEAKSKACDLCYEETGLRAFADERYVCCKVTGEYPYEWR